MHYFLVTKEYKKCYRKIVNPTNSLAYNRVVAYISQFIVVYHQSSQYLGTHFA